jgi:hypothetical protein
MACSFQRFTISVGGGEGGCSLTNMSCVSTSNNSDSFGHWPPHHIQFHFTMRPCDSPCRLHATVSILDRYDNPLCQFQIGTANNPRNIATYLGKSFRMTAEEKRQSVRADGSIRLRAVVRLFLD